MYVLFSQPINSQVLEHKMYVLSLQQKFSNCPNLFDNLLNPPLGILSLSVGQSSIPLRLYKHVRLEQHTLYHYGPYTSEPAFQAT